MAAPVRSADDRSAPPSWRAAPAASEEQSAVAESLSSRAHTVACQPAQQERPSAKGGRYRSSPHSFARSRRRISGEMTHHKPWTSD